MKTELYGIRSNRFHDLTGKRFGRLVAICFVGINKYQTAMWRFKCDCGKEVVLRGKTVKRGMTKSCGCLWRESISLPPTQASLNKFYADYKRGAKDRGLSFELTQKQFVDLTSRECCYCGVGPKEVGKHNVNGRYVGNGIDRVDNNEGYTKRNSVPCCTRCNIAKSDMSRGEFIEMARKIYERTQGEANDVKTSCRGV